MAPTIAVSIDARAPGNAGSGEFVYSGLAIQNANRGKIETAKTDRVTFPTISLEVSSRASLQKMTASCPVWLSMISTTQAQ